MCCHIKYLFHVLSAFFELRDSCSAYELYNHLGLVFSPPYLYLYNIIIFYHLFALIIKINKMIVRKNKKRESDINLFLRILPTLRIKTNDLVALFVFMLICFKSEKDSGKKKNK